MPTVLIIEDDPAIAELIKDRLEENGYETIVSSTILQSMEEIKKKKTHLATLDVNLPDGNGLWLLDILKNNPETKSMPIIIVTSEDLSSEKTLKADGYIKKPIDFKKLLDIIKTVVNLCVNLKFF